MFLKSIQLKNFRNIKDQAIKLDSGFNLFVGNNAQGKTNIIEAVHLFATASSFRTSDFRDMIEWNSEESEIMAKVIGKSGEDELKIILNAGGKEIYRNSKKTRPGRNRMLGAVLFAPEEIFLLRGTPAERRKYIDVLISKVRPAHAALTRKYSKVLSHRNTLLQDDRIPEKRKIDELKPWDFQLAQLGAKIIVERSYWCEKFNFFLPARYSAMAKGDGKALFVYRSSCGESVLSKGECELKNWIGQEIRRRRDDEMTRRITLVGPHRDDFDAVIGDGENRVKQYGSQGQHRTFVVAMKLAEIDFIEEFVGEKPVLLLDDVTSELDVERNSSLFEYLKRMDGQVFITTTSEKDLELLNDGDVSTFEVCSGSVLPRKRCNIAFCADRRS